MHRAWLPLLGIAASVSGCVAGGTPQPHPPVQRISHELKAVLSPALNTVVSVELGEPFISRMFLQSIPTISIASEVTHEAVHNGITLTVKVPAGKLTEWGTGELGTYYEAPGFGSSFTTFGSVTQLDGKGGLIVPAGSTSTKLVYRKPREHAFVSQHPSDITIIKLPDTVVPHPDGFARQLIYTGVSKNTITLLYREFSNDFARPAFTQELKYDLGEGKVIGFKGARFEVIKATNTQMQFKVLKHLD